MSANSNELETIVLPATAQRDQGLARLWTSAKSSVFVRQVLETYITRLLLIGLGLVTTVVVARLLGPEGRGLYAVAAAVGTLGVQFGNLGLHTANGYLAARDRDLVPQLTGNTLVVSFGLGTLVAVALGIVLSFWPDLIPLHGTTLLLALVSVPLGLAYLLLQNLMLGVQDVRGYNLLETAAKIIPLAFMVALFVSGAVSVTSFFATGVAALVVNVGWSLKRISAQFAGWPTGSLTLFTSSFTYALKAYLAALFGFLVLRSDLFMVEHMLGPEQAGYYSIAFAMADYVSVLAVVIATILFPKLSAVSDVGLKLKMTRKAVWGTAALLAPLLLFSVLVAKPAVRILFGSSFMPAALAFTLLMPGMLFLGLNMVGVQFLNSIGYPKSVVFVWAACTVVNIAANLWAIPHYGIAGASAVSTVSYFLAFFFNNRIIRYTEARFRSGSIAIA